MSTNTRAKWNLTCWAPEGQSPLRLKVSQQRRETKAQRCSRCHGNLPGRKLCVVLFRPGASHLLCPTKLFKSPPQGLLSRQIPELSSWFQKIKYGPGYCLHAAGGVAACRKYRLPFSAFLPVSRAPTEPSRAEQRVGEVTSRR